MDLPARIGKYELQEFLGGGMSHVFRAKDTVLDRMVAVKILTEQGCANSETKARFLLEAKTAGGFAHDNIIAVYDFGEDQGRPFIVMEFLRGQSLRDAIKAGQTGTMRNKLSIALQIAKALEYIHQQRIVHRDIKPDNVHIDASGRIKLMDFGIAKSHNVALTQAGFTLGTPYYMAPEQVLGQQVTLLADVYAFGILVFELMAGSKPIKGDSIEKVFQQILSEPIDLTPLRESGAPPQIIRLVERCTAKNAADRPQGFSVISGELEKLLEAPTSQMVSQAPVATPASTGVSPVPSYRPQAPSSVRPAFEPPPTPIPQPQPDPLPSWMRKLPAQMQTQEWLIAIIAVGVIFGMSFLVLLLRFLTRLIP